APADRALPPAIGLGDVVPRARLLGAVPVVRTPAPAPPRGRSRRPRAALPRPVPRRGAPVDPGAALRLPLHHAAGTARAPRVVAPGGGRHPHRAGAPVSVLRVPGWADRKSVV